MFVTNFVLHCFHLRKMVNVVMIHNGEAHFLQSVEVSSNSGEQYFQLLKSVKAGLEEKGVIVCAVVGDNASGVQNALNRCRRKVFIFLDIILFLGWSKTIVLALQ